MYYIIQYCYLDEYPRYSGVAPLADRSRNKLIIERINLHGCNIIIMFMRKHIHAKYEYKKSIYITTAEVNNNIIVLNRCDDQHYNNVCRKNDIIYSNAISYMYVTYYIIIICHM